MLNSEVARVQLPQVGDFIDCRKRANREPDFRRARRGAGLPPRDQVGKNCSAAQEPDGGTKRRGGDEVKEAFTPDTSSQYAREKREQWLDALLDDPALLDEAESAALHGKRGTGIPFPPPLLSPDRQNHSLRRHAHEAVVAPFLKIDGFYAQATVRVPISGEVVAVNDELIGSPWLVSQSPERDGWLCELQLEDIPDWLYAVWKGDANREVNDSAGANEQRGKPFLLRRDYVDFVRRSALWLGKNAASPFEQVAIMNRPPGEQAASENQPLDEEEEGGGEKMEQKARQIPASTQRDIHRKKNEATLRSLDPSTWPGAQFVSSATVEEFLGEGEDDADVANWLRRELSVNGADATEWETLLVFPSDLPPFSRSRLQRLGRQVGATVALNEEAAGDVEHAEGDEEDHHEVVEYLRKRVVMMRMQD
eukprot:g17673.t1